MGAELENVSLLMREEEKNEHITKLTKIEKDMTEVFQRKVEQKMEKIRETEEKLHKNMIEEFKKLETEKNNLNLRREGFLKEKKGIEAFGLHIKVSNLSFLKFAAKSANIIKTVDNAAISEGLL